MLAGTLGHAQILEADGDPHDVPNTGIYVDSLIPAAGNLNGYNYLTFTIKGADGGAYKSTFNDKKGGGGAVVRVSFEIGTGVGQLRPGGTIRSIVGKRGESVRGNTVAGGGGGGGTAILYKHPNANITCNEVSLNLADAGTCWVLLAVAGGGGGAYLEGRGKGGNDGECGKNGGDGDGGNGGCNGNGGNRGTDGSATAAGGGGSAFSEGGGGPQGGEAGAERMGGEEGNFTGGIGGDAVYGKHGGFGYGGGGAGGQALALAGGGGGGGYSGGGGGYYSEGGGGGSFTNNYAQNVDKEEGGSDLSPDAGKITYQFSINEGPTARCKDITVTLVNDEFTINGASIDGGSTAEAGESISGRLIGVESIPGFYILKPSHTFRCGQIGEYTVRLLVQSTAGKISECVSRVEVVDEVAPVVNCTSSLINVELDTEGTYEFSASELNAAGTASDACGEVVERYLGATLSCARTGIQTVPLIVEDNSGNSGSCQLTVNVSDANVIDQTPPVLACNDVTVTLDANGNASVTGADIGAASYDNCAIQSYTAYTIIPSGSVDVLNFFPLNFNSCSRLGTYTGYLTKVIDQSGNERTGSCTATITLLPYSGTSRWYVNGEVSTSGGGTSWSCAFKTLQEALLYADDGDEIWVAAGTYYPDEGPGQTANDRLASFGLKAGVAIYGGFAGGETSLAERNWETNVTVLSGDLMENDGSNFSNHSDNSYHVLKTIASFSAPVVISGLTIRGGNAEGRLIFFEGGGVAEADYAGGGILISSGGDYTFEHCVFADCNAQYGGAIITDGGYQPIQFNDCKFENNRATVRGGAVAIRTLFASIINCTFRGNESAGDGAAVLSFSDETEILNCVFSGNSAPLGVVYNGIETMSLTNCSLSGNAGLTILNAEGGTISLDNCIVWGNELGISTCNSCTTTVNHSFIEGGYSGTNNLDIDPLFVDQPPIGMGTGGDLRLQACSPALDAGNDSANSTTTDLVGNDRKFDAISGGAVIDLGAYEFQNAFLAVCRNQTVWLDQNGTASLDVALLDGGSSGCLPLSFDVEGESVLNYSCDDGYTSPLYYTLTVTNPKGEESTCDVTVEVIKNKGPLAMCQDATVHLNSSGEGFILPADIDLGSSDACGPVYLQLDQEMFDCSDLGMQQVILTVTDDFANTSQCTANLEIVDRMPPVIDCRTSYTLGLGTNIEVILLPADLLHTVEDNCTSLENLQLQLTYEAEDGETQITNSLDLDCDDVGTFSLGVIAFDASGNYSDPCEVEVVVADTQTPALSCPPDLLKVNDSGQCGALINDLVPEFDDNCSVDLTHKIFYQGTGDNPAYETSSESGILQERFFEVGTSIMVYTASDPAGNAANCSITVTVKDEERPQTACQDLTVSLDESGRAALTTAMVDMGTMDNCHSSPALSFNPNGPESERFFSCDQLGSHIVPLIATDASGNQGICISVVTVSDTGNYCRDCEPELLLEGVIAGGIHRAAGQIEASGKVTSDTGVGLLAGEVIRLTPGFHAEAGSRLIARIEDCEPEANTAIAQNIEALEPEIGQATGKKDGHFQVFPNPFSDQFRLLYEMETTAEVEVRLISMDAKIRQQLMGPFMQSAGGHQLEWDLPDLPAGIYIIQLRMDEVLLSRKLIKIR